MKKKKYQELWTYETINGMLYWLHIVRFETFDGFRPKKDWEIIKECI
jgi:hypothetical protein